MIEYRNDVRASGVNGAALRAAARKILVAVGEKDGDLCIALVDDATIRALNKRHRAYDRPTDVLSFAQREGVAFPGSRALGDVVISVDTARRQAASYGAPLQRELERLLIHGVLHLLGHDHHERGEREAMKTQERRLAQCIGMPWPYEKSE
ncbi:MAG: rRNA maturation RNase YbeY [Candidatus Tyrphobacter sp.]